MTEGQRISQLFGYGDRESEIGREIDRVIEAVRQPLEAEIARLKEEIDTGRCCDNFERLPKCGHPRCVVSEVCELCQEIEAVRQHVRLAAREEIARFFETNGMPGVSATIRRLP